MCLFQIILAAVVTFHIVSTEYSSIYKVTAFNADERDKLYNIYWNNDDVVFLNGVTNDAALPMSVVVNEGREEEFEIILQDNDIEYTSIDSDLVQQEFDDMNTSGKQNESQVSESFLDWESITLWIDSKCKKNVPLNKIIMGQTYEKRELLLLKLSIGGVKPAVFIMGGEQGRNWMSTAIILNFINTIVEHPFDNLLIKTFDLYFMPVFNPDGYEFSMKHDRFWNKNRKSFFPLKECAPKKFAVGVNIDRNWYFQESSSTPLGECQSVYIGHRSLTEEEPKALAAFLNSIANNLIAFINLRGDENLVTVPYAETYNTENNEAMMMEILHYVVTRVKTAFNINLKFSTTAGCFYNLTGNSADWVKMKLNIPIVYTLYLKKDNFILPHIEHIVPQSNIFMMIINDSLILAHSIYGPLFSKGNTLSISCNSLVCTTLLFLLYFMNNLQHVH